MGRKKASFDAGDGTPTPKPRRIGLELADSITEQVADYCAARNGLSEAWVKDVVREKAREAAEAAVNGKVAQLVAEKLA